MIPRKNLSTGSRTKFVLILLLPGTISPTTGASKNLMDPMT